MSSNIREFIRSHFKLTKEDALVFCKSVMRSVDVNTKISPYKLEDGICLNNAHETLKLHQWIIRKSWLSR